MLHKIDLSRADLNLLVLFETVLDEGHVARAARRLNLSASAVSHGLGRLRRMLNDPLFLKTPKGVVPTARANELAGPVADALARIRRVMATAEPFDPAKSNRRFTIAAPDAVSAVLLPPLLTELRRSGPGIAINIRQLLPTPGIKEPEHAWQSAFADLEARLMDVAVIPSDVVATRFVKRTLYEEDFIVAARAGHPFAKDPSLARYCDMPHLVVSQSGGTYGFVDEVLEKRGRSRKIALTVPNFMFALATIADTDLIAALPRRLVALHAARFNVIGIEPPIPLGHFRINAVAPQVALMDAAVAWLFDQLAQAMPRTEAARRTKASRRR
jgi:DNA-binding transcriptional LysR family regulator